MKATSDPVTVAAVCVIAGAGQAANRWSGYGQGAQGYSKRYAASYANLASGLFIGGAALPSLFKQDPRYFYKGPGTKHSRFLYAISRTLIFVKATIKAGSQTIPRSSATSPLAAFLIYTSRKETVTAPD